MYQLSSGQHDHLKDLSQVQFLVLDEADRMTQEHCFPQLVKILDMINEANPRDEENEDESSDEEDDEFNNANRLLGLRGIRGEAQLTMLTDDILEQVEGQRSTLEPKTKELADTEFPDVEHEDVEDTVSFEDIDDAASIERPKVHRQTFIYSATLTLPFTSTKSTATKARKRKKMHGLDGGIAEILEKTRAVGETKVVDLSSSSSFTTNRDGTRSSIPSGVRLPPGLVLEQIKCTQKHKDSHLYAYLMTTAQGASGPCLVFCNSIAAVRRVGATLQALGMPVKILHAHMQQVCSFCAYCCC
jgi:ATP-dependent RNA helicase DDX24/MAK5